MFLSTRFVLLARVFVFLTAMPANGTEEFENPPRPFPVVMGEQVAANLVDLIFLFDRVASDSPTARTPDYLERGRTALVAVLQRLLRVPTRQNQPG